MLKLRILTALILVPLVLLAIFKLSQVPFAWVLAVVLALAGWEWASLFGWTKIWQRVLYILALLIVLFVTCLSFQLAYFTLVLSAMGWLFVALWLWYVRRHSQLPVFPNWVIALLGFFVLIPFWHGLVSLHGNPSLLLYMLLLVWTCDTAAYFGGRRWGKRPLASTISPKKTMEGLITAVVVTLLVSALLVFALFTPGEFNLSLIAPVFPLIVAAVVGDLFESALKRMHGVKDSGQLLPGHGGILDRIDSLTAAAPVFTTAVMFWRLTGHG